MFPTRKLAFLAAGLAMLLAAPSAAVAATDKGASTDGSHATTASSGGGLVRTFVGLAIVLGVIYGLYWVLKQVKSSRETAASGQGLESVATIPLGTNRSLHLVRAGKELMLLGVADQAVVPIRAYREEEARALGLIGTADTIEADATPSSKPTAASAAVALRDVFGRLQQRTVRS
jgi:flagellar protein FliO/FliZ